MEQVILKKSDLTGFDGLKSITIRVRKNEDI